eukprot:TRINITY_DN19867_c0_g1_i1.p1 TRINITY_DN19867_c0_g1~~TRINITY_DN19867_c0_g1_i1.p1  ORF type:complete len:126 (-),score=24.71 TRINITY_DN19867_c0_g1_i1:494-871(-)
MVIGSISCVLLDLPGKPKYRVSEWTASCREADVCVYVVDAADPQRLQVARAELDRLLLLPELSRVPLVLLLNKQDRPQALSQEVVSVEMNLSSLSHPWCIIRTSSALQPASLQRTLLSVLQQTLR